MALSRRRLPSLTELVTFECAARHGSFTRAGEELSITQGAVSRQIRALEEALETTLFVRVRRSVVLTDAGRLYLTDVRRIIADVESASERVTGFGADLVLNLAVLPTFAIRWLIPRLPSFMARQKGVTVNLLVRLEPFSFDEEPFDAAIHFGEGVWPGGRAHYLCRETIVAVVSPAIARRDGLREPADLIRATLLHQTTRPQAWSDWFAQQGVAVPPTLKGPRLEQFGMIAEAAVTGLGVALVPRFLVETELASQRLIAIPALPFESRAAYWLVVPERKLSDELVAAFLAWIRGQIGAGIDPDDGSQSGS